MPCRPCNMHFVLIIYAYSLKSRYIHRLFIGLLIDMGFGMMAAIILWLFNVAIDRQSPFYS